MMLSWATKGSEAYCGTDRLHRKNFIDMEFLNSKSKFPSSSFNTYPLPSYLLSQKNMSWKMIMTNLEIPCQVAIPPVFCLFQTICSVVFFSFRKV